MNIKRALLSIFTGVTATALLAASASAYDLNKDFKTGWSISTTIPGSEFEDVTETSVITITYTADASLADMEGHDYWVLKPMINDTGWPFLTGITQLELSEGKDTYVLPTDGTEIKFTLPAADIEHIQTAGLAFMGHGITVGTLTISNDEPVPADFVPAAENVSAADDDDKGSPDTGIADVAAVAGLALVAGGAILVARKRK